MPEFRSKEGVYDLCVSEGKLMDTDEEGLIAEKARNTLQIAEEDFETAKDSISKKRWNSGYKTYYDVLRELIESYIRFERIKSWNHQCLFSHLCVKHPELELDWNFFEKIRTKRNGINYYSSKVSEEDWKEVAFQFNLYINLFKKEIGAKIKELEKD